MTKSQNSCDYYKELGYSDEMIDISQSNKKYPADTTFENQQLLTIGKDGKNILTLVCSLGMDVKIYY